MMYDDSGWGWWWMGAVAFVVLLILVAGVVAVVFAARPRAGQGDALTRPVSTPPTAALAELDVRFARGELDEDTYRRTRDLLTRPPTW